MEVVVLSMHRSGSSLVARLLVSLGVHMGDELLPPDEHQRGGYYEDEDFLRLNAIVLQMAGGNWAHPPPAEAIAEVGGGLADVFASLIHTKQAQKLKRWGWKDPRTCLTVQLYHELLPEPRYVWVHRGTEAIIASLTKRAKAVAAETRAYLADGVLTVAPLSALELGSWTRPQWRSLMLEYQTRGTRFLEGCGSPALWVYYERLVARDTARAEVQRLAEFVGAPERVDVALKSIEYRS